MHIQVYVRVQVVHHGHMFLLLHDREGVPKERVTLFVANEEEMNEYRKALEAGMVSTIDETS